MKISVIVPVFNVEAYLAECIESVIRQTHKDFEIILVDDGSTDQSTTICDQYAERYPTRIIAIHIANSGPLHARIKAMGRAAGDVFAFLDADDCLRNDALEKISQCFEKQACDMVLFNAGQCERFSTRQITHTLDNNAVFEGTDKKQIYEKVILGQIPNSVCLKAVRANCTEIPENIYLHNAKHGEDLLLSALFITNCKKIVYLNEELYHYRDRPGSAIHSFNIERKESVKLVHMELEKCIDIWKMPELKPLHNARKVRGWVEQFKLLLKNKRNLTGEVFKAELISMSEDPYFRFSYENMNRKKISFKTRLVAFCIYYRIMNCLV